MLTITGDIVLPGGIVAGGSLTVDDTGRIAEIAEQRTVSPRSADIDADGQWILPGFIDLHVHGGGGADFMHGTPEAVRQIARTHARFGTTGLLATTLTASGPDIDHAVAAITDVMDASRQPDQCRILGVHLEGPYLCHARRGAQPEAHVRPPDVEEFNRWNQLAGGRIRQITLAPEIPGAEALVRAARQLGVNVSMGHTSATAEQASAAVGWGLRQATHLFNAMPPLHHRRPGAAGTALMCSDILAEIICDGVHLHPLIIAIVLASKGIDGVALITDAIEGAAMPDGQYALGGMPIFVRDGTAAFADGTLAGSVLTMDRAFQNLVDFTGVDVSAASRCASGNAARQLGLASRCGSLTPGLDADLTIMDPVSGAVVLTLVGGTVAYRR